ncbi:hypothetical protein [Adlercreutzia sp. ZJ154]|uniref:hypothetical protein n=1 Tax=Adlercreutzia sp. ZJ154 TaxID=2709790 RepID=UPI0013EDCD0A|nr:hypothetical protein [Adlercreutzia sp. ZJ154]
MEKDNDVNSSEETVEEVFEMEIAEDDIYAYLVDGEDNEIGFIIIDEAGNEQEYYYVDMSEYEIIDSEDVSTDKPKSKSDSKLSSENGEDDFDLGITREGVAEATADMNDIYKEGAQVAVELKETLSDIQEELSFLKKR